MGTISRALRVLREEGSAGVGHRIRHHMFGGPANRPKSLVALDDVEAVDWRTPHPAVANPSDRGSGPWTFAWIMSPPGRNSGGHQNLFRFIRVLEEAGHTCIVYLYSNIEEINVAATEQVVRSASFEPTNATIEPWTGEVPEHVDGIFATGWETAYPSFRSTSMARRFYFVQDFEPWFTPVGTSSVLAEATYRFGFQGITAGGWLAHKLDTEFGMPTSEFDFGADREHYHLIDGITRDEVFFYARAATERRGYDLGILALDLVSKARPDVTINLVGEAIRSDTVPFRHVNIANIGIDQLGAIYNRSVAALVLSFTNLSLLPLELLSAGTIPVVNDGPNNRMVIDNPNIVWAPPVPAALAEAILEVLDRADRTEMAARAAASTADADWARSGRQVLEALERGMR